MTIVAVSSKKKPDKKIPAKPGEITDDNDGASILFLPKVPEMEVLTLQMEHEGSRKELS
jgi:hypothetical protein